MSDEPDPDVVNITACRVLDALRSVDRRTREAALEEVRADICMHCGKETPDDVVCHCTNDE